MQLTDFEKRFMLFKPNGLIGFKHQARQSAVMILVRQGLQGAELVFCKRPMAMRHHPGEICFAGGKKDNNDSSLLATAKREVHEELGLLATDYTLLGELDTYWTLTGFAITPFVAKLHPDALLSPDSYEVSAVFSISLTALSNPEGWRPLRFERGGKARELQGFITEHGLLWGATAQIVRNLVKQVSP